MLRLRFQRRCALLPPSHGVVEQQLQRRSDAGIFTPNSYDERNADALPLRSRVISMISRHSVLWLLLSPCNRIQPSSSSPSCSPRASCSSSSRVLCGATGSPFLLVSTKLRVFASQLTASAHLRDRAAAQLALRTVCARGRPLPGIQLGLYRLWTLAHWSACCE